MKNTTIIAGIIALLLLAGMAEARQTVVTKASEMKIDLLRYDPSPIQPGDTTDMWFEIINLKDAPINDFDVKLVEEYPFKLVSDKTLHFSRIDAGGKLQFKFTVEVNTNALEGNNNVFIQYYSRTAGTITSEPFIITIKRMGSIVSTAVDVSAVSADVPRIAPGAAADVAVSVKNSGSSAMRDVTIRLDLLSASMPFAPLGMTTEQTIRQIDAGGEGKASYKLIATPDAKAGVYKIPVIIKYYDGTGQLYNISDVAGVMVGSEPKVSAALDSTELTKSTKTGKLVLKIINYGTEDIKFARLSINPGAGFSLLTPAETYIGNVDSDDYETTEFRLTAAEDSFTMPVALSYMDSNNKEYAQQQDVGIVLYTPKELGLNSNNTWAYLIALLVIAGAYFGYRKYKSKKQK